MATSPTHLPLTPGIDPRPKPGVLATLGYTLTLRSYGNNLLTRAGRGYLFGMSLIMLLVALAEAVGWGYLGSTFIPHYPLAGWLSLGGFVFILMWIFDRSLMTADLIDKEHTATLQGLPYPTPTATNASIFTKFWAGLCEYFAFIFRLTIALVSLIVVAPYVSEIVFKADIQNKQQEYFRTEVNTVKQRVIGEKTRALTVLDQRLAKANAKYQDEISGKLSGRYGRGISAQAIEQELIELKQQQKQQIADLKSYNQRVDAAVKNTNATELALLNIRVDQDSPVLRKRAVQDIKAQHPQEFWHVELTVRALLGILAAALFGLKLMQPRHLKLYYSSRLQQQWSLYCLGKYDALLPISDRREWLLNSRDALPDEFEGIIVRFMQDTSARQQREQALEAEEKATKTAQAQAEKERQATQAQAELEQKQAEREQQQAEEAKQAAQAQAENAYYERLAAQKALTERRELERSFFEQQIALTLADVEQLEAAYLQQYGAGIDALKQQETTFINEMHELEKEFKTHQERVNARDQRILQGEREHQETRLLLAQTRQRPDSDSIEVLRLIADAENALRSQAERLDRQRAERLGFEANQKFYQENNHLLSQRLDDIRQQLHNLQRPLQEVGKARATIESHRVQFLLEQGLQDSPHQEHSETELPHLVEKLRGQLQQNIPDHALNGVSKALTKPSPNLV